jgi:hypothetical protein
MNIQQSIEAKEETLLMALVDSKKAASKHIWFLDSGCSNHMCGNKNMFCDLDNSFRESVKLGNNSGLTVQGKGMVRLWVNGIVFMIT